MQTVHFIYTVPTSTNPFLYRLDKYANKINLFPPSYRNGNDKLISWSQPIYAPHSITYHVLNKLKQAYKVKLYDWRETGTCHLKKDDILLFQPIPDFQKWNTLGKWEVDKNSLGWKTLQKYPNCKSIVIVPYNHTANESLWLKEIFEKYTQQLIVICGDYWTQNWDQSPYGNLVSQPLQVNMGINVDEYSLVKESFNPKGKRKFLYIGNTNTWKNTIQLEKIASAYPNFEGGYISSGEIKGWKKITNFAHLTEDLMKELAIEYDFFLNTSSADAQATTILEQMCFGLGIACTPESGYSYPSIIPLDKNDTNFNIQQIELIQKLSGDELRTMITQNRQIAAQNHNWNAITTQILDFIKTI
ncbi:hypothetical protein QNI16_17970 [Cytophagaceae bacterium YF14B1]|uniref:Uncharacterized protein n=1 Tax=Xanthocytophaga flava TaxID=3048013 RepID=A0AAE3QS32_9BACT|nr:hypothetical protein [Xanthocytophaga flavus]MDJ1482398.1 hypothetical protein [Xanthocytophaga flavus]